MTYISKEKYEERTKMLNAVANGRAFLESEEGKNAELVKFLNALKTDRNTEYYAKHLQFYLFCMIMEWFIENDFLPNKKADGSRVVIASDIAATTFLEMKG